MSGGLVFMGMLLILGTLLIERYFNLLEFLVPRLHEKRLALN